MATNPRRFHVTELDFDDIKSNFKKFLKGQTEFTDYDFEGSGMNILLDTLAYNTHYLAYNVNMAMNEAFLDSALLRSSVVSHAKTIGYTPRSARAPIAYIDVLLNTSALSTATLPKGSVFTSSVDEVNYTFVTNSDYIINPVNGILRFINVPIYEGTLMTTTYIVDKMNPDQRFILSSNRADTTTLKVSVQNSSSDTTTTVYNLAEDISSITDSGTYYFLQEIEEGKFQVYFGDGIIGQELSDGNLVILEYIVTNKELANSANIFSAVGSINGINDITVSTISSAIGGAEPETIESIRYNAPLDYSSQGRAVTTKDYELIIPKIFPNTKSIQVWGGEDNDPPKYGEVFASVQTTSGNNLTVSQKNNIINRLKNYNIASIRTTLIDVETTNLYLNGSFKYDSSKTTKTKSQLESIVKNNIISYNNDELEQFDGIFRYSKFTRIIDNSDSSILSSIVRVKMEKQIFPLLNTGSEQYIINFSNQLYHPHMGHNNLSGGITQSTGFKIFGEVNTVYIDDDGNGNLRLYYLISGGQRIYVDENIGTIDYEKGIFVINSLNITSVENSDNSIEIIVIPASLDVVPVRNQIIKIDIANLQVLGEIDTVQSGTSIAAVDYSTTGVLY
jgi:hypothetical protein